MWEEIQADWERFAAESQTAISTFLESAEEDEDVIEDEIEYPIGEDRLVRAKARVGQRFFRSAVLSAYNQRCCITGLSIPTLLVASHIVPWRRDTQNRVNPRNGLLLSALHDRAFDSGLLTITDDMAVQVSNNDIWRKDKYFSESIGRYDGQLINLPEKFSPAPEFLAFHRRHIFQG